MNDVDRLKFLEEEIGILKSRLQEHDTGHIHTTIRVLEHRMKEVKIALHWLFFDGKGII